ncbi:MAG: AI-2E family transporter [Fusobacteriaceae bacterium]|nr:AI-2E family transporter [Fusobacteriaceae bacterium]
MEKKNFFKLVALIIIFVIIQTYFQNTEEFSVVIKKWIGYFVPLIWGIFIALLLGPLVEFLEKKMKLKKLIAVILSIIFMCLVLILLALMVIPQLISSIKELNSLYPHILEKITIMSDRIMVYLEKKELLNLDMHEFNKDISGMLKNNVANIQNFIVSLFKNMLKITINLTNFFLGLILAFFILLDKKVHMNTRDNIIKVLFGKKRAGYIVEKITQSRDIFIAYIAGKIIVSFIVGLSVFVVLEITKTPYASLSAVLLGVGNMIPYIGSIVGGVIAAFLIFLVAPIKVLFLLVAIGISQLLDGFIVGPKIIGDKVGLDSFWVMLSMIVFGGLFGVMGMFLGIPIMCIIKILYRDALEKINEKEGN